MRILACLFIVTVTVPALADNIDLYIISGQSNGFESRVEAVDGVDPALTQVYPGIRYAFNDMYYETSGYKASPTRPSRWHNPNATVITWPT